MILVSVVMKSVREKIVEGTWTMLLKRACTVCVRLMNRRILMNVIGIGKKVR